MLEEIFKTEIESEKTRKSVVVGLLEMTFDDIQRDIEVLREEKRQLAEAVNKLTDELIERDNDIESLEMEVEKLNAKLAKSKTKKSTKEKK